MGDIQSLKHALRAAAKDTHCSPDDKLSDTDYDNGFALFTSPPINKVYENFIIPTLRETLIPLFGSRNAVSILEIGPSPKTILATLPGNMRLKINRYTAFEPNSIFASKLQNSLTHGNEKALPLPGLRDPAQVLRTPYELGEDESPSKFDVVLFCHSMYGLSPKRKFIEQAVKCLGDVGGELVVVFHRAGCLNFDGLVCHQTASSPDSTVSIPDTDENLNTFASFVTGIPKSAVEPDVRLEWRDISRSQGSSDPKLPGQLVFHAPEILVAFNKHAGALQDVKTRVPLALTPRPIRNREACHTPYAAIDTPTNVAQVQECVRWALRHRLNLTVIGGSHSGHCVQPHVVALDMSGFNEIHVTNTSSPGDDNSSPGSPLILVGAGCTSKDIINTAMQEGLTVPLGDQV